eukprot:793414-Amphidinium_carterae.1
MCLVEMSNSNFQSQFGMTTCYERTCAVQLRPTGPKDMCLGLGAMVMGSLVAAAHCANPGLWLGDFRMWDQM